MTDEKFVHLHSHTHYSILDGLNTPKAMAKAAKAQGFKTLAITDHGTCAGWLNFQKACRGEGIKPILGSELYMTDDRKQKDKHSRTYHLLLLAKNKVGMQNLMHLSTLASTEGFYRYPRIDFDLLSKHHEGLICTSGCPSSQISKSIIEDDGRSMGLIHQYHDLFKDDFYLEVMTHNYKHHSKVEWQKTERDLARQIVKLSKETGIKAIATNDNHYASKRDAKYHEMLLCMQTKKNMNDPKRFTLGSDGFYIKSYEEMLKIYGKIPDLLSNTVEISEKIPDVDLLTFTPDLLPDFGVPEGFADEAAYLKVLISDGLKTKGLIDKPEYRERIKFEMDTILNCGYTKYFLILWDIMNYAANQGIRTGIGRGSAAGCLCLYVLDIVKVDPIKYDLLFERFLNPERISPPDVDVDFDYYRRNEIYDYIYRKYGQDHCCKIGTYNSFQSKAVVRYGAKALDIGNDWHNHAKMQAANPNARIEMPKNSMNIGDQIAKTIPIDQTADTSIEALLKGNNEFRSAIARYPDLIDCARHIEGNLSSAGVHPAGIIVCKDRIDKYIPLRDAKGQVCSQFDGSEVEELGLLKFDLLALKTLTVVDDTLKMVKKNYGIDIDIDNLEPDDKEVFDLLNGKKKGMDNRGIFQFESDGISQLLKSIRVDSFEDMIVANALYRPGPLGAKMHIMYADYKHGRKKIQPLHPKMKEILKQTYSIMVYQEDFMKIAQVLAGFTKGQSDTLRKAVGKKKKELLAAQLGLFVDGCKKNGIDGGIAKKIFEQIEFFGGYGFNRSHSAAYAFLAYQTGYLKVHYPLEFMTALLSSEINNNDKNKKLGRYVKQSEAMGVAVKPTSINLSGMKFRIEKRVIEGKETSYIRSPLTVLPGVGEKAAETIVSNQPYSSLEDFLERVDTSKVNSRVFHSLVDGRSIGPEWGQIPSSLLGDYEAVKKKVTKKKKEIQKQEEYRNQYSGSLFDSFTDGHVGL